MTTEEISQNWPTVFELASQIQEVDLTKRPGKVHTASRLVTEGFTPEPFPTHEGYFNATPEQLASLRVPKIEVGENGQGIKGFQRDKVNAHARKIARAMVEGKEMPPLMISIFPDGQAYVDDGQHRALAAIIARRSVEVVVKRRNVDQARELFANQGRARKVSTNDTLLTGDSAIELYVQDAVTNPDHPWAKMVSPYQRKGRFTPTTMVALVGPYAFNSLSGAANFYTSKPDEDFDVLRANQLARLVGVFGTKETNPDAFRTQSLRAIAAAAVYILRRNPRARRGDVERWLKHMPTFDFGKYPHLRNKEHYLSIELVEHWNKHLQKERRVDPALLRAHS